MLTQNICNVCASKALTIEEIAETLCVSALFIENRLDELLYVNYIEEKGSNKYKTTFFIQDAAFCIAKKQFEYEHLPKFAEAVYEAVHKNLKKSATSVLSIPS